MKRTKVIHITHNDLDGVGSPILSQMYCDVMDFDLQIFSCDYDNVNKVSQDIIKSLDQNATYIIWYTDISMNEEVAKTLDELQYYSENIFLQLIDHHKTALWLKEKYKWAQVMVNDENEVQTCATYLFMLYLEELGFELTPNIKEFAQNVRDYDTFAHIKKGNLAAERLNILLQIFGWDNFMQYSIKKLREEKLWDVLSDTSVKRAIEGYEFNRKDYISTRLKTAKDTFLCGYKARIVFAEQHTSLLGVEALKDGKNDICAIVSMPNRLSFRTTSEDIDVSEIASCFGGGGHRKAAGATLSEELLRKIISDIFASKQENTIFSRIFNKKRKR